jgi:hypothetical protein
MMLRTLTLLCACSSLLACSDSNPVSQGCTQDSDCADQVCKNEKEEPRVRAKDGERLRQTSIHLPVELHKRVRKYAFDQEVTLSTVMVDAIQEWLDAREG